MGVLVTGVAPLPVFFFAGMWPAKSRVVCPGSRAAGNGHGGIFEAGNEAVDEAVDKAMNGGNGQFCGGSCGGSSLSGLGGFGWALLEGIKGLYVTMALGKGFAAKLLSR
jgi:hypothetical protein